MPDLNILLFTYELSPPWDNGLKVYGRGLSSSLQTIDGAKVDTISNISDHKNGRSDGYDYVHVVQTGLDPIRKALGSFKRATIFKHIVTPSVGIQNAIKTKMGYSFLNGLKNNDRLVKCFSSEFVAKSYFMEGKSIIPPCVDVSSFKPESENSENRDPISLLGQSATKFGIENLEKDGSGMPLIMYSGPLTEDRFPYRKVLSSLRDSGCKMLIIGRPTNNGASVERITEVAEYANKLGMQERVSIALKLLNEEEKIRLLNYADIIIQPFGNSSNLYVAVDPPIFLLEAMSCGKPVITSKSYSFESFIQDGQNGYTVNWDDTNAIRAVVDECKSKKKREDLGSRARKTVIENYSFKSVAESVQRMYIK